jgi:hypothetical protein
MWSCVVGNEKGQRKCRGGRAGGVVVTAVDCGLWIVERKIGREKKVWCGVVWC